MVKVRTNIKFVVRKPYAEEAQQVEKIEYPVLSELSRLVLEDPLKRTSSLVNLPPNVLEMVCERSDPKDLLKLTETCSYLNAFVGTLNTFQNRTMLSMTFNKKTSRSLQNEYRAYKTLNYNGLQERNCYLDLKFVISKFIRTLDEVELLMLPITMPHFQRVLQKMKRLTKISLKFVIYEKNGQEIDEDKETEFSNLKELTVVGCDMMLLRHFKASRLTHCNLDFRIDSNANNEFDDLDEAQRFLTLQPNLTHLTIKDTAACFIFGEKIMSEYKFQLEYLNISIYLAWGDQNATNFDNFMKAQRLKKLEVLVDIKHKGEKYMGTILRLPLLSEVTFNLKTLRFFLDSELPENHTIKIAHFKSLVKQKCMVVRELRLLKSLQGLVEFDCHSFEIDFDLLKTLDELPNLKKISFRSCKIWEMITLPNIEEIVFENQFRMLKITNRFIECNRHIKKLTLIISSKFNMDLVSDSDWIYTILALPSLEYLDLSKFGYNKYFALELLKHKSLKTIILPKDGIVNAMIGNSIADTKEVKDALRTKMTVIFK